MRRDPIVKIYICSSTLIFANLKSYGGLMDYVQTARLAKRRRRPSSRFQCLQALQLSTAMHMRAPAGLDCFGASTGSWIRLRRFHCKTNWRLVHQAVRHIPWVMTDKDVGPPILRVGAHCSLVGAPRLGNTPSPAADIPTTPAGCPIEWPPRHVAPLLQRKMWLLFGVAFSARAMPKLEIATIVPTATTPATTADDDMVWMTTRVSARE